MIVSQSALTWPIIDTDTYADLGLSPDQDAQAKAMATEWLWHLTACRYGTRTVVDRPATAATWANVRMMPAYLVSMFGTLAWPFDTDPLTGVISSRQWIELARDASDVTAVTICDPATPQVPNPTPAVLVNTAYRLEGNYLVRQDGGQWPQTQNMIAALGSPNTWSVEYSRGVPPDTWGQIAAGLLAEQFGKALLGSTDCKLPYNVQTVARSGVTINRNTKAAGTTTGVQAVDQYVATVNPQGLQSPGRVWSPDVARNQSPYNGSYVGSQIINPA